MYESPQGRSAGPYTCYPASSAMDVDPMVSQVKECGSLNCKNPSPTHTYCCVACSQWPCAQLSTVGTALGRGSSEERPRIAHAGGRPEEASSASVATSYTTGGGRMTQAAGRAEEVAPVCARPGCYKPSWNGAKGEFCSRACRDARPGYTPGASSITSGVPSPNGHSRPHAGRSQEAIGFRSLPASYGAHDSDYCMPSSKTNAESKYDASRSHIGSPASARAASTRRSRSAARSPVAALAPKALERGISIPSTQSVPFFEGPVKSAGIIGFYFPGYATPVDECCKGAFLANFFPRKLEISAPGGKIMAFQNAEAAFQSLKFWARSAEFQNLSGEEAFAKKKQLQGLEDRSYAGHGSNWAAMRHVLQQKFKDTDLMEALKATGNTFLLEHNLKSGRDTIWSNNNDGSGKNWLGLQLMLLRDQLTGSRTWTSWIQQHVNLETGEVFDEAWQQLVMTATRTVLRELGEVRNTAGSAGYRARSEPSRFVSASQAREFRERLLPALANGCKS